MIHNRLMVSVLSVCAVLVITGCSKQVRQTPLQRAQSAYDRLSDRYIEETTILKNNAKLDQEKVREQIIESMCAKHHKHAEGAPLHTAFDAIKEDIDALHYQAKKLIKAKKMLPTERIEADQMVKNINVLIDRLYDIRHIITSNKEYREETRYLNSLGAQLSPVVVYRCIA